jgi:hypothetical protein
MNRTFRNMYGIGTVHTISVYFCIFDICQMNPNLVEYQLSVLSFNVVIKICGHEKIS